MLHFIYLDALKELQKHEYAHMLCLEISKLAKQNKAQEKEFFTHLPKAIFVYDYILPERNIYYPASYFFGLYFKWQLGSKTYNSYMQRGAVLGILEQYGYKVIKMNLRFAGAFGAIYAERHEL